MTETMKTIRREMGEAEDKRRGTVTYRTDGSAETFDGRDAVEIFRLASLIGAVKLEAKGIRVRKGWSALKEAKRTTGLRTNDRVKQLDRLQIMLAQQKERVNHVTKEE